ncbi:unnamed protein product [[Actinomadura] parvosata subsp. kistnae]|nr:unnamed protein product [Actinomadura parvosata subsp. kistnae]
MRDQVGDVRRRRATRSGRGRGGRDRGTRGRRGRGRGSGTRRGAVRGGGGRAGGRGHRSPPLPPCQECAGMRGPGHGIDATAGRASKASVM